MIKILHKNDTQITPFAATKDWQLSNVFNDGLILTEHSGSPIALEYLEYTNTQVITNSMCNLALENQENDKLLYRDGKKSSGIFYPDTEESNLDGTFKRMVYSQIKTTFYNGYRDPTKMWGMEYIDFDNSQIKKFLTDEFKLFDAPTSVFGEKIINNTVTLYNTAQDNDYVIVDDGKGNLFAKKNLFSRQQEIGNFSNSFFIGTNSVCNFYFNPTIQPITSGCFSPAFQSFNITGSISSPTVITYNSPGSGSLGIWFRSNEFDTVFDVWDPDGIFVDEDDVDGWNNPDGIDNSALNVQLTKPGNYQITMSAYADEYGGGNFNMILSPGNDTIPTAMVTGSGANELVYIPSSNYMCSAGGAFGSGNQIVFYDLTTNTIAKLYGNNNFGTIYDGVNGCAYSKIQDKIFSWVEGTSGNQNFMLEFDNIGNLLNSYSLSPINQPGEMCYDYINNRILLTNFGSLFFIWDCISHSIIYTGSFDGTVSQFCTYSEVNNKYYVSNDGGTLLTVDASTFVTGSTLVSMQQVVQYLSESKIIVGHNSVDGLVFSDPVSDTIIFNDPTLVYGTFEDAVYDPCANAIIVLFDKQSGASTGLCCFDSASFSASNFIPINNTTLGGSNPFGYAVCFAESNSKVYSLLSDGTNNFLYSTIVSIPTGSIQL